MTSPRYSIITYHHDPEYLTHLWKYLSNNESPSSWEWIIGYSIDDLGKLSLERIKQLSIDIPNISLLKIPSAKDLTIGKALNTCAEKREELIYSSFPVKHYPAPNYSPY